MALALVAFVVTVGLASATVHSRQVDPFAKFPVKGTLPNGGKIWALLVAGSNGYFNYRHQADVCHAYQILHQNGIPDENIIVMMYDDIATDENNPTPNVIINSPGGPNVYKGVPIDYSRDDVNSANFIAVLTGNKSAVAGIGSGRVINSNSQDHIFVNFVDHGAPGFLCFPNDELHAKLLEDTLQRMRIARSFNKMVLYVEACESGSMFDEILPDNSQVFVLTAADPRESSYACYYDKLRGTYLGDVFSVKWMEDSDIENLTKETLHHQFQLVRSVTNTSHVEEYGDLDLGSLPVSYFQGYKSHKVAGSKNYLPPILDAVSSRDVHLEILKRQHEAATDMNLKRKLKFKIRRMQKLRKHLDSVFSDIASEVAQGNHQRTEFLLQSQNLLTYAKLPCYETLVKHFSSKCFKISENYYTLTKMKIFVNMCSVQWTTSESIVKVMDSVCQQERRLTSIARR